MGLRESSEMWNSSKLSLPPAYPTTLIRICLQYLSTLKETSKHSSLGLWCLVAWTWQGMNWSGRFQSQVPSRQTSRRTPGSRSRTSSCPRLGRVSQPGKRVTQRMTNSCISTKGDPIGLQPVFPSKALEMLIEILLNPRRVVFQDRTFI